MKHVLFGPEFVIISCLLAPVLRQGKFYAFPSPYAHRLHSSIVLFLEVFYNINYTCKDIDFK